jgi:hypothetical protein
MLSLKTNNICNHNSSTLNKTQQHTHKQSMRNCSYLDTINSNTKCDENDYYHHYKSKMHPFRRCNSAMSMNNNNINTNNNTNYLDSNYNVDYKSIVKEMITLMNSNYHSTNINEYNIIYEMKNIIEQNKAFQYTKFDEYKDYCIDLMSKKNINTFTHFKQYIDGLMNQRDMNDKYMKNLSKMLCQKPKSVSKHK